MYREGRAIHLSGNVITFAPLPLLCVPLHLQSLLLCSMWSVHVQIIIISGRSQSAETQRHVWYICIYIYSASHTGIIYYRARVSAKRRETRDKFGLQIIRKIDLVIAAGIMARWRSHLLYRLYRRRRSLLLCPFPTGYRRRTLLSVETQKKIRDLTATIYTKERCRKACRKCTTPRMAFSRIYFYRVKTFVVAFVDESILFQVPLAPYRSLFPASFNPF